MDWLLWSGCYGLVAIEGFYGLVDMDWLLWTGCNGGLLWTGCYGLVAIYRVCYYAEVTVDGIWLLWTG